MCYFSKVFGEMQRFSISTAFHGRYVEDPDHRRNRHPRLRTIIIEGDRAAVRFLSSSRTPGGDFRLKLMTFFRFSGGRIIEDDTIFDTGGRACEG
jgi:hypothetical protein